MQEQRQNHRGRTYLGAEIGFNRQISPVDCLVRNLSPRGAMLQLDQVSAIPKSFELKIPSKAESYRAQVVWQKLGKAGVVFENIDPGSTTANYTRRPPSITDRNWLEQRIDTILNRRAVDSVAP
jgi:hypothetical protein